MKKTFQVRVDPAHPAHLVLRHLLPARVVRPLRRRQECRQPARQEPRARGEPQEVPEYVNRMQKMSYMSPLEVS